MVFGKFFHKDKRWKEFKFTDHEEYDEIKQMHVDGDTEMVKAWNYNDEDWAAVRNTEHNYVDSLSTKMAEHAIGKILAKDVSLFKNTMLDRDTKYTPNGLLRTYSKGPIYTPKGVLRVYSRHPAISRTARRGISGDLDCIEDVGAIADMVTSFMVKDNYDYRYCQGKWVYYVLEGDTIRRR